MDSERLRSGCGNGNKKRKVERRRKRGREGRVKWGGTRWKLMGKG